MGGGGLGAKPQRATCQALGRCLQREGERLHNPPGQPSFPIPAFGTARLLRRRCFREPEQGRAWMGSSRWWQRPQLEPAEQKRRPCASPHPGRLLYMNMMQPCFFHHREEEFPARVVAGKSGSNTFFARPLLFLPAAGGQGPAVCGVR